MLLYCDKNIANVAKLETLLLFGLPMVFCETYALSAPGGAVLLGTPELLFSLHSTKFVSSPLIGLGKMKICVL